MTNEERLAALLRKLHRGHEHNEDDPWYSCPAHLECSNVHYDDVPMDKRPCNCGYLEVQGLLEELGL